MNDKRIEWQWRRESLKAPAKQLMRRCLWLNESSCVRLRTTHRHPVWVCDFVEDRTHDGRKLPTLVVVDEYLQERLAIDLGRWMSSENILERPALLLVAPGITAHLRSDDGSEFTPNATRACLSKLGIPPSFIERGSP